VVQGTVSNTAWPGQQQLQLSATVAEITRKDNESLASAARDVVQALAQMREHGWIDDHTAIKLAFKFAGEPLGETEIERILATAPSDSLAPDQASEGKPQSGAAQDQEDPQ
jgi:hypothetical protein